MVEEFKSVLKNRNFVYIWTSQILSQLTINIMNFIILIKLFGQTGSAIATSLLWVTYALPAILIGPVASTFIDMVDKRKVLMITNILQGLTIFLLAMSHMTSIFILYEVVFIYSLLNQFYVPAEASTMPSVLKKNDLTRGNGLSFITQQASLVLGFGVAGLLNHFLGFDNTLYLCALFLFMAFLSVSFLPELKSKLTIPPDIILAIKSFLDNTLEGYRFIKDKRRIIAPFLLLLGFQVALTIVIVSFPVIAKEIFDINLNAAGIFIVIPAALGAMISAFNLPRLIKKGWRKKRIIENSLMILTITIATLVFVIPELSYVYRIVAGFITVFFAGLAFVGVAIPSQTYMQEITSHKLRGRVFGNFWFLTTVVSVIPVVFSGTITEIFGVRFFLFILAAFAFTVFIMSTKYADSWLNKDEKIYTDSRS